MPTDPAFRMTVEDVFVIRGRGTVATGRIESGTLRVGDEVRFEGPGGTRKVKVNGIESFRKALREAKEGENVGVLLRDVTKEELSRGAVLSGQDPDFTWKP